MVVEDLRSRKRNVRSSSRAGRNLPVKRSKNTLSPIFIWSVRKVVSKALPSSAPRKRNSAVGENRYDANGGASGVSMSR